MSLFEQSGVIRLTCPKTLAPFLKQEVELLNFPVKKQDATGVEVNGTLIDCIKLNLHLRTCHKVLYQVQSFKASGPQALYKAINNIAWEQYLKKQGYFSIGSTVFNQHIKDTRFANQKAKDAIVDRFWTQVKQRPNSGPNKDQAVLYLYWHKSDAAIFIDTSGEPIAKHGYREKSGHAPMLESLAAAVILASGWDQASHFVNPMCGTGTLAIEAALMALNRPPGLFRENYGFMHLKGYQNQWWHQIREEAMQNKRQELNCRIVVTDHDEQALKATRQNAQKAGVLKFLTLQQCDFAATPLPEGGGTLIMNPEYGERMGATDELQTTYERIGDFLTTQASNFKQFVFTGNQALANYIPNKPERSIFFYNGAIECRLLEF